MARPSKLTPELHSYVIGLLRQGHTYEDVAIAAGLHRNTIGEWIRRGRQKGAKEPYKTFAEEADRARVALKMLATNKAVSLLQSKDEGTAERMTRFVLERRFPEQWSEKVRHTVATALDEALEALEQEFHGEPEILARIARCLAGEPGHGAVGESARGDLH